MPGLKKIIFLLFIMIMADLIVSPPLYCAGEWEKYSSSHFIIYFRKEIPKDYVKKVSEKAEEYYVSLADNFGFKLSDSWSWDKRVQIYIFKDEQEFKQDAGQRPWASGSVNISKKIIKSYPSSEDFLERVLPHELGHLVFRALAGHQNNIPLWLDEGIAISQEKAGIKSYSIMMRDFLKNHDPIPIEKMNAITPRTLIVPQIVYPQAASIVDFLLTEFKKEKFQKLCKYLRSGYSLRRALAAAYGFKDFDDLSRAWRAYLNSLE